MAKREKIDYRELSEGELRQKLLETKENLFRMRLQSAVSPLKNPHLISVAKREIARILTVMGQKGVKA